MKWITAAFPSLHIHGVARFVNGVFRSTDPEVLARMTPWVGRYGITQVSEDTDPPDLPLRDPWPGAVLDIELFGEDGKVRESVLPPRLSDVELRAAFDARYESAFGPRREAARPNPTWVSTLQPGHGWVNTYGTGTVSDDTNDFVIGTQSLSIVDASASKTGLNLDLTGKALAVLMKVDSLNAGSAAYPVIFAECADGSDFHWTPFREGDPAPWVTYGELGLYTLPVETATKGGTPNRAAITKLEVRVYPTGGTLHLQAIGTVPANALPSGAVTITFDDGYTDALTAARKYMTPRGLRGSLYLIPSLVDTGGNHITTAQVRELHDVHGWDIQCHGLPDYTTMTAQQLRDEWTATKQWLQARGFGPGDHMAYPGGHANAAVVQTAREFFTTARLDSTPMVETWPVGMPMRIRGMSGIGSAPGGTPLATAQALVTAAATGKHWVLPNFHQITPGAPTDTTQCSASDFAAFLDTVVSSGAAAPTVSEMVT